jgi:hypothetical protein
VISLSFLPFCFVDELASCTKWRRRTRRECEPTSMICCGRHRPDRCRHPDVAERRTSDCELWGGVLCVRQRLMWPCGCLRSSFVPQPARGGSPARAMAVVVAIVLSFSQLFFPSLTYLGFSLSTDASAGGAELP